MAKLLVYDETRDLGDPEKTARFGVQAGDIIGVFPDDHQFGRLELLPPWRIVDIPGTVEEHRHLAEPDRSDMRDRVPSSMFAITGLPLAMLAKGPGDRPYRRLRKWAVDEFGTPYRKQEIV